MFNSTNMYSIKHYTATTNKSIALATVYIMNVCETYPNLYKFVIQNVDNTTVDIIMGGVCWIMLLIILRNIVRTCLDPFSVKLHTRITELENKLSEEEDMYSTLHEEKCKQDAKIDELTRKLGEAEHALADIKTQYLCCRTAAQAFINSTLDSDVDH